MAITETGDRQYLIQIYTGGIPRVRSRRVNLTHMTPAKAGKEIILIEKAFKNEVKGTPDRSSNIRFKDFVKIYMEGYAVIKPLRPKTIASYKEQLETHILPYFGHMKPAEIMPHHLIQFYAKLKKQTYMKGKEAVPLSARTIYYQHQILSSMFSQMVKMKYIKENPCKMVSLERPSKMALKKKRKEKQWEVSEAIAFIGYIKDEPLKYVCMTLLALVGGLRTEEIQGLSIDDITDQGVIIRRTCKYVAGQGMVVEDMAKNDSSERSVALPKPVVARLKGLRSEQKALQFKLQNLWEDYDNGKVRILLFTQRNGKPMSAKTFYHWLKNTIDQYNGSHDTKIKQTSPHGLRHTSAALLSFLGNDNRANASRMGHALTSTFMDMYGSEFENADVEIAERMGAALKLSDEVLMN